MDHRRSGTSETRFSAYVEGLVSVIGHADRAQPLRDYCTGLIMPCERKSVEPLAAVTAPARVAAQHQSLLHFVGEGHWSDDQVLAKVREMVLPRIEQHGSIEAWIIDDTGFAKKGRNWAEKLGTPLWSSATISPSTSASGNVLAALARAPNLSAQSSPFRVSSATSPSSIRNCTR